MSCQQLDLNRVLVIDDDPAFGRLLTRVGEGLSLAVTVTEDPSTFIKTVRSWQPTVVIIALQMPGADGIELMRELVADKCAADVILASGVDTRTLHTALRLGRERGLKMAGVIKKPARVPAVREVLSRFQPAQGPLVSVELMQAIESDQLFLEYQPKLDCRLARYTGVEALVRWNHPSRGLVRPDQFVTLAEETDLIDPLTDWVFTQAVRQGAAWQHQGLELDVAVNISAKNLAMPDFPDRLAARCGECGIDPDTMILELTETGATRDALQMMEMLTRLRLKGFRLSIDDFGTGYSSMSQLQRMPFSEMKIDRSFVTTMEEEPDSKVIVEMSINLADKVNLNSVAEGVESKDILASLLQLNCNTAQGYFLSRPLSPEAATEFLIREHASCSNLVPSFVPSSAS